jgi:hypothetical protein
MTIWLLRELEEAVIQTAAALSAGRVPAADHEEPFQVRYRGWVWPLSA